MDKDYIIKKWLNGDLTQEEQLAFDEIEDSGLLKEIIEEAERFKGQNPSKVLAFEKLEEKLYPKNTTNTNWVQLISRIAAVFVIGIGLYFLFRGDNLDVYTTQLAQKEVIILPDESQVTLNSLSELSFNGDKWEDGRNVELIGEAYFDVAKGKRFDVITPVGTISVLGTEFNVMVRDSIFKVSCYEGLVKVVHNNTTTRLPAGKAYHFLNNTPKVTDVVLAQPKWLQNLSVFDGATIEEVFKALENEYKIQVVMDQIEGTAKFTGAFEHDNLNNALKAITQTLNLTYEFNTEKTVIIRNAKK